MTATEVDGWDGEVVDGCRGLRTCGKASGYTSGACRGDACREAQRVAMRVQRAKHPEYVKRQASNKRTLTAAGRALREAHPEEFEWYVAIERGEVVDPVYWSVLTEGVPPLRQMLAEIDYGDPAPYLPKTEENP